MEPDPAERLRKYNEAERALVREIPQIPLFGTNRVTVWNQRVKGLVADPLDGDAASFVRVWHPPYSQVWVEPS
jgi:hypothetical protein